VSYVVELPTVLALIGGLGTLVAVVASTLAYYKATFNKDTIEVLKENNQALVARVDLLTKDVETLRTENQTLSRENETLRSIASADRAIKDMNRTMADGHKAILEALTMRSA
jgi:FtsZ-binding cell division protein ZapB